MICIKGAQKYLRQYRKYFCGIFYYPKNNQRPYLGGGCFQCVQLLKRDYRKTLAKKVGTFFAKYYCGCK